MPRSPPPRTSNGKRRRVPVRDSSRSARHMALNANQQSLLQVAHHHIGEFLILSMQILCAVLSIHTLSLYYPPEFDNYFDYMKQCLLFGYEHISASLRVLFHMDSFLADIHEEEEEEFVQERKRHQNQEINHLSSFGELSNEEIRFMTRFSHASLEVLKRFCAFPEQIYLCPGEDHPRQVHERRNGCYVYFDEELILFSLYRFAHGSSIAIATDRFSGGIDKWMTGFKFFVCHVHSLVYPTILGLNGIKYYVPNFPSYAASIKVKCSNPRL